MQAFAFLAAGIGTLIAYFVLNRVVSPQANLKPAQIRMCGVIMALVAVVCMGYMLHYEFSRWAVFTAMGL